MAGPMEDVIPHFASTHRGSVRKNLLPTVGWLLNARLLQMQYASCFVLVIETQIGRFFVFD
jgi:hypothetical protein